MENKENNDNTNVSLENIEDPSQLETSSVVVESQDNGNEFYVKELNFLKNHRNDFKFDLQILDSGDVQQPFCIGDWVFLLVMKNSFPKISDDGEFPVKVYFVKPNLDEICKKCVDDLHDIPYKRDMCGNPYLVFKGFRSDFENCLKSESEKTVAEIMILRTKEFVDKCLAIERKSGSGIIEKIMEHFIPRSNDQYDETASSKCKKVILSDRAFMQIYKETHSKIRTETGGLLLGHYQDGIWYVIEASDPGKHGIFEVAYHESDVEYQNHVCEVISRLYKYPLVFLGMWHRHPGSMDFFSGTDDRTNYKYAKAVGNGCISALINYDPEFRMTFYYVENLHHEQVKYTKVKVEIGNDKIPGDIMTVAQENKIKSKYL